LFRRTLANRTSSFAILYAVADDTKLIQIIDAALAEAAGKAGAWLKCRPGCCECCLGVFEISGLDAERLRRGLLRLEERDAAQGARVRFRAGEAAARLRRQYPADTANRALSEAADDDAPCPVLDPVTGTCDLYESRPLVCRTFGPAIRVGNDVGTCELCFPGATAEQIAACAVELDAAAIESPFVQELAGDQPAATTVVALALS
jgi:Fe-S-cluster containining protein